MDIFDFYRLVAVVLVGNALTILVVYVVWLASKAEKKGFDASFVPLPYLLGAIIPFGIVVVSVLSLD